MLVVTNNSKKKESMRFPVAGKKKTALDALTGTQLPVKAGRIVVDLPAMSGRLIKC